MGMKRCRDVRANKTQKCPEPTMTNGSGHNVYGCMAKSEPSKS